MHTSIALWSHPRSLSTAFERSFMERGDFRVFHEAFSYVYYVHENRTEIPHKNPDPTHPRTYPDVKRMMEQARRESPVFHKDFPYHALAHLLADPQYLLSQVNTFLVRDPAAAVPSHLAVHPTVTSEALGYAQLWQLFEKVAELTGAAPVVVDADRLAADPHRVVARYCAAVGIDFQPGALSWSPGARPEWGAWLGWHHDVMRSSGFSRPSHRRDAAAPAVDAPRVRALVEQCAPFYEALTRYEINQFEEVVS